MAKKNGLGTLLGLAALAGAAAVGYALYKQYKEEENSFAEDFDETDDEFDDDDFNKKAVNKLPKYPRFEESKAELVAAAKETFDAAKEIAADFASDGALKAADIIESAKVKVHEVQNKLDAKIDEYKNAPAENAAANEDVDIDDIDGDVIIISDEEA